MTKKEIIDKVYDDYLKDYGRVGYIGMNSIEKACKSEFEKNGIEKISRRILVTSVVS